MTCDIRPIAESDVPAICALAEQGFGSFYQVDWHENARALYQAARERRAAVVVADFGGQVVGYCNLRSWPGGGWIDQIVVSGGNRRGGVGRMLLDAALGVARQRGFWKVSLITSQADSGALSFFQACGWDIVGNMKDEIGVGVDGVLLSRIADYELHPNKGHGR